LVKKLSLIIIVTVSIFLLSSPLHAGGRVRGGRSNVPLGFFIIELGSAITGGSSHFTPAAAYHGILRLKVTTEDAEMYLDGRFIGLARDFKGPAVVSVPSGDHVVQFKYKEMSYTTNTHVALGRTTSLTYTFNPNDTDEGS